MEMEANSKDYCKLKTKMLQLKKIKAEHNLISDRIYLFKIKKEEIRYSKRTNSIGQLLVMIQIKKSSL